MIYGRTVLKQIQIWFHKRKFELFTGLSPDSLYHSVCVGTNAFPAEEKFSLNNLSTYKHCSIVMTERSASLTLEIRSLADLGEAVQSLLDYIGNRRIVAFSGEIGAGKTTFIQAFCQHLGVVEPVTSPTFSLVNEYQYEPKEGEPLQSIFHMDLYRLEEAEEALDFGIEEYLDSGAYCLIEWPELIQSLLPEDTVWINVGIVDDSTRKMLIL